MATTQIRVAAYLRAAAAPATEQIERQSRAVRDYAAKHRMRVVRTFTDVGRSGLCLEGRDGFKSLTDIVQKGNADFAAVLLFDETRWGRAFEIVGYCEYLLRRAGIAVQYCCGAPGSARLVHVMQKQMRAMMDHEYKEERRRRRDGRGPR